jgi:tetratricopeptide (TPR) repeat protein
MSFKIICSGCGAPSGLAVGICPFCKSVMTEGSEQERASVEALTKLYAEGRNDRALALANEMFKNSPELIANPSFAMTFIKVLFECEAPGSHLRSVLAQAQLAFPGNPQIADYLEILDSKSFLKKSMMDPGEVMLMNVIRRSPDQVHAHFTLGAHFYWEEQEPLRAIPHLETCVRLRPVYLRAWACLGGVYHSLGNQQLAQNAFRKCLELESDPSVKEFFAEQMKRAS